MSSNSAAAAGCVQAAACAASPPAACLPPCRPDRCRCYPDRAARLLARSPITLMSSAACRCPGRAAARPKPRTAPHAAGCRCLPGRLAIPDGWVLCVHRAEAGGGAAGRGGRGAASPAWHGAAAARTTIVRALHCSRPRSRRGPLRPQEHALGRAPPDPVAALSECSCMHWPWQPLIQHIINNRRHHDVGTSFLPRPNTCRGGGTW